ncbi:cellulose binding domain-containing protein [Streptomyces argenteolus]|uniref:Cellulose binding domain-containing protein n=1 Tax=Streptomyces argenteolus TaxID=67274 RepID=A0ABW6X6Y4_9ACTN
MAASTARLPDRPGSRIEAGGSQYFGFQGAYTGTHAKAAPFTLNGATRTVA